MGATTKRQQLDVQLSNIEDLATRAALASIVEAFNGLSQQILVSGAVQGNEIKNGNGKFTARPDGNVQALGFSTNAQTFWRVAVESGTLASLADKTFNVGETNKIMMVAGFATRANNTAIWRPINYDYPTGQGIVWETDTTAGSSNTVKIRSTDVSDDNLYRIFIVYLEG